MADLIPRRGVLVKIGLLRAAASAKAQDAERYGLGRWAMVYKARADAFAECIALLTADSEVEVPGPAPGASTSAPEVAPTQSGVQ